MNIAIVYPSLGAVGGAENVVVWLAESLTQRGHRVVLFTKEFSEKAWGEKSGKPYAVHLLEFRKRRSTLRTNREAGAALERALSGYSFDVINPHNYPASLWVYYARQQQRTVPPVLLYMEEPPRNFYEKITDRHLNRLPGLRNIWNRYRPRKAMRRLRQALFGYRRLDKAAVLSCDRVLANSKYTAELARTIYGNDTIACPLGIAPDRFKNSPEEHLRDVAGVSAPYILTVARIELAKNFDTILHAARILKDTGRLPPGFRHKIAGKGPLLDHFRKKCAKMGLSDTVEFLGFVPDDEMRRLYADSLFLVHIPLDEPFGLVPLEAALFRKTSLVSDHGGPSENVIDGTTGLHADALSPIDVARKITGLLQQSDLIRTMGEKAYLWVLERMTWDLFVNSFERHLNELVY